MTAMRVRFFVVLVMMAIAAPLASCREDPSRRQRIRQLLFEEVQPVALENCTLERFGEANDGGYLVCGNLLSEVKAGYSYGISGYDGWGCEVSRRLLFAVHQYDCFDTRLPECPTGEQMFHPECIAGAPKTEDGRIFRTMQQQIAANRDRAKRLVVKMDIEGAEWESLAATPLNVLDQIDQLVIELHGIDDQRYLRVVRTLKGLFYVAHLHYNNFRCRDRFAPFPADVFEVLFVNKRLGRLDPTRRPTLPHPEDAPNNPHASDCQAAVR